MCVHARVCVCVCVCVSLVLQVQAQSLSEVLQNCFKMLQAPQHKHIFNNKNNIVENSVVMVGHKYWIFVISTNE